MGNCPNALSAFWAKGRALWVKGSGLDPPDQGSCTMCVNSLKVSRARQPMVKWSV